MKHDSPLEHCAQVIGKIEYFDYARPNGEVIDLGPDNEPMFSRRSFGWCDNYKGFRSYRHIIENK